MAPPARGRPAPRKSAEAFRTISEVADDLGVPQHVLRFWETRFAQVKPMKRNGGRRLYRPDHVALLRGIKALLYDDGLTIKGVQKVLREQGVRAVATRGRIEAGELAPLAGEGLPEDAPERLAALRARMQAEGEAPPATVEAAPETAETAAALGEEDRLRVQGSIARLEAILARLENR